MAIALFSPTGVIKKISSRRLDRNFAPDLLEKLEKEVENPSLTSLVFQSDDEEFKVNPFD